MLARAPAEITLAEIVSAVDGPIAAGDFGEPHTDGACDHEGQCVLLAIWADVGEPDAADASSAVHPRRPPQQITQGTRPWPGDAAG